jgi:endonuclease/exonuclease/phosphatase (EEP) superfamily protein YafD
MPTSRWLTLPVWILALATLGATLLPLVRTDAGLVRMFDFPRAQIAALLAIAFLGALLILDRDRWSVRWLAAALLVAAAYQVSRILPYTPLAQIEAPGTPSCPNPSRVELLVANVLQSNHQAGPLLAMVERTRPDLVLLLETDQWWDARLAALGPAYPFVVRQPQQDTYGMHLFSRLELIEPVVRFLLDDYVPSISGGIRLRSGAVVRFHGVHPKPPRPFHSTTRGDVELMLVAREVRGSPMPVIVAGDLNDVAWSRITRRFQAVSGLLDPRVGRGLFSTYNANWPLLRWPLDHVFFDRSFRLVAMQRMDHIGSDHFPVHLVLCHQGAGAARE